MRPIAVFDTNILFSAVGGWKGPPYRCVEAARAGETVFVTCPEILAELDEKLKDKLGFEPERAAAAIADLLSVARVVTIAGTLRVIAADADDDKILECAVVAGATHVVTGDRRHLLP